MENGEWRIVEKKLQVLSRQRRDLSYKLRRGTLITRICADVFLWDLRDLWNLRSKKEEGVGGTLIDVSHELHGLSLIINH